MNRKHWSIGALIAAAALLGWAQETPRNVVATYDSLADAILAVKRTEANFVRSLLDGHHHGAAAYMKSGDYERVAAEMALFANEGDNAIGGVRKRLLEGGHHHNAEGEAKGIFEPGYVIVTKKAKQQALAAATALRKAQTDAGRNQAWQQFDMVASALLRTD
ncbi:MAG: hypothetical protein ACYTEZ_02525 [Planctomycetota bacterium]|jgi:hypothetical protein